MNYRHAYHAGNFADVIKHIILIIVLSALKRKETPFCFLDTHAGIGLYDLQSIAAQKKQEYHQGILPLLSVGSADLPESIQHYIDAVLSLQPFRDDAALSFYPGSPWIAQTVLRPQDQMILCELHADDYRTLKQNMTEFDRVAVHHMDGYSGMKAFLPPKLKRGLVMIDPPFEVNNEFDLIVNSITYALKHWRSGHFMIWYPIKDKKVVHSFYERIRSLNVESFAVHFSLLSAAKVTKGSEDNKLSSCGILLIQPPFQVKEQIQSVLPLISSALQARGEIVII